MMTVDKGVGTGDGVVEIVVGRIGARMWLQWVVEAAAAV